MKRYNKWIYNVSYYSSGWLIFISACSELIPTVQCTRYIFKKRPQYCLTLLRCLTKVKHVYFCIFTHVYFLHISLAWTLFFSESLKDYNIKLWPIWTMVGTNHFVKRIQIDRDPKTRDKVLITISHLLKRHVLCIKFSITAEDMECILQWFSLMEKIRARKP